jgi:hypothetical protein
MVRKVYACSGGPGSKGMSYFRLRTECAKVATERGVKVRKYNKATGEYE